MFEKQAGALKNKFWLENMKVCFTMFRTDKIRIS